MRFVTAYFTGVRLGATLFSIVMECRFPSLVYLAKACAKAGIPNLKFHDLRRTAVRNVRRDGFPQAVRMCISGYRTDSTERRYNSVDVEDRVGTRVRTPNPNS